MKISELYEILNSKPITSLEDLKAIFSKWLYLEDTERAWGAVSEV